MSKHLEIYKYFSLILSSNLHTSSCYYAAHRQTGNFMRKVLGNSKKKSHFYEAPPNITNPFSKTQAGKISTNPRRIAVLNKLFMRNITDLMTTETYTDQILGLGVEINKVNITPDYKILKVYWTSTNSQQEGAEKILKRNAGLLRHQLSQLRLMGNIPVIQFVQDKHFKDFIELNKRLAIADYGEDGPANKDPAAKFMSELELSMQIDDSVKEELVKLEKQEPFEVQELELPIMTHCVFNLDHADIMNRVRKCHRKPVIDESNDGIDNGEWAKFKLKQYSNMESITLDTAKLQREAFNKFLQQRKILKTKHPKQQDDDLHFSQEQHKVNNFELNEADEDYIFEDVDEQQLK